MFSLPTQPPGLSPSSPPVCPLCSTMFYPSTHPLCNLALGGGCHIPLLHNLIRKLTAWSRHAVAFPAQTLGASKPGVQHLQAGGPANPEKPALPTLLSHVNQPRYAQISQRLFSLLTFNHSNDFFFTPSHSRGEGGTQLRWGEAGRGSLEMSHIPFPLPGDRGPRLSRHSRPLRAELTPPPRTPGPCIIDEPRSP